MSEKPDFCLYFWPSILQISNRVHMAESLYHTLYIHVPINTNIWIPLTFIWIVEQPDLSVPAAHNYLVQLGMPQTTHHTLYNKWKFILYEKWFFLFNFVHWKVQHWKQVCWFIMLSLSQTYTATALRPLRDQNSKRSQRSQRSRN